MQTSFTEPPSRHWGQCLETSAMALDTRAQSRHSLRARAFSRHQTTIELLSLSLCAKSDIYIHTHADNVQVHTKPMSQHQTTWSVSLPPLSLFTRARARSLSTPEQCLYLRAMSLSGQRFSLCAMTATPLSLSLNSQSSFSLQYFLTGSCFNARAGDTWCRCNAGTERRSSRRDDW